MAPAQAMAIRRLRQDAFRIAHDAEVQEEPPPPLNPPDGYVTKAQRL
jgi:hypothetical protein